MNTILKIINKGVNSLNLKDGNTIKRLNGFFIEVNIFLKGDNSTLIYVKLKGDILRSNILNDDMVTVSPAMFKAYFLEWLAGFYDDDYLLKDILNLMFDYYLL